jgi:DNA-binding MarR family transcriptional regulator/GNAT superfamily N-acetyltransferase
MDDEVAVVRSFNRMVTQRIGALNDDYLARARPLGASRLLWEIDEQGVDLRTLRSRLELDSGYASRLLRRLEADHLVDVAQDPSDRRIRVVRLTDAGRAERAHLDRLSDNLAAALLEPLTEAQRVRLVEAMATVERLLTAGLVEITPEDPASEEAQQCLRAYIAELDSRFDSGFDPEASISATSEELRPPTGAFLIARLQAQPIGCGAVKFHGPAPAEVKRMWVAPSARGLCLGRRILRELERRALEAGATAIRLETNERLGEAVGLYRSSGYREVPAFNDETYAQHWFEKSLPDQAD